MNLRDLEISQNDIEHVTMDDFSETAKLQKLLLKSNKIATIDDESLSRLSKLTFLDLSQNHLRHLTDNVFDGLDSLRYLFLDNNKIDSIERYTFHGLKKLVSLERIFDI